MHLVRVLKDAQIVDGDGDQSEVRAGSVVSITYEGDDEPEKYLVGSIEEQRADLTVVSPGSPMGEALVGASVGDTVEYESPAGTLSVTVVEIE